MDRLMCTRCGGALHCEDGLLKCSRCGAAYEKESQEETLEKLEKARAKVAPAEEERKRREEAEAKAGAFRIDGNYIYYGRYPQQKVADAPTINALKGLKPGNNGYIQYGGEEYAEAKGEYFLVQPIKWKIIEKKGKEALVVSNLILDAHRYDDDSNNYMTSEIRGWLNHKFLSSAFQSGDKRIRAKEVDNSAATTDSPSNPYACENTRDKVFLLSYQDYQNASYGFSYYASRECNPTAYAVAKGAYKDSNGYGWYWTRSPGSLISNRVWSVDLYGNLYKRFVSFEDRGVRPGLWLNIAE